MQGNEKVHKTNNNTREHMHTQVSKYDYASCYNDVRGHRIPNQYSIDLYVYEVICVSLCGQRSLIHSYQLTQGKLACYTEGLDKLNMCIIYFLAHGTPCSSKPPGFLLPLRSCWDGHSLPGLAKLFLFCFFLLLRWLVLLASRGGGGSHPVQAKGKGKGGGES